MKNLFTRLLLFFLFFDASKGLCKNVIPDVRMQPISPQAWSFVTYGGHDLNLHTGTVGVTIPIYTFEDRDFKLPISLTYSSSGFMPHKQSDIVGYDWFLHVGGIITRERRGMIDESGGNIPFPQYGYMYYSNRNSSDLKYCLKKKDLYGDARSLLWRYDDNGNYYETSPDIFHFNFMGYRGSFQLGPDNMIYIYNTNCPQGELKITKFNLTSATIPHLLIEITDGYGYKYTFGGDIHAVDYVSSEHDYLVSIEEQESIKVDMNLEPTSWHLTKIEAPNGRKVVFNYSTYERNLISHIRPKFEITTTILSDDPVVSSDNENPYFTTSAQLDDIIIDNWNVHFNYVRRGDDNDYYNERASQIANVFSSKLLSQIQISSNDNDGMHILKTCDLKYCRSPKMLLEEVSLSGEGKYMMKYYGDAKTPVINTFAVDHWGYWNGVATVSTFIPLAGFVNQYSSFESNPDIILSNSRDANEETTKWGMLTSITYPTKGRTDFDYELNNYSSVVKHCPFINTSVYDYELMQVDSIGTAGGLRIKSIKDYDINNKLLSSREYKYNYLFDDNYDEDYWCRTGILLKSPQYLVTIPYKIDGDDKNDGKHVIKSDWDLYSLDRYIVEYRFVAEIYNDGSTIEYRFSTWDDYPDIIGYTTKECTYSINKTDIVYIPDYNECDNFRFGPSGITNNTYVDPAFSNGVYNLLKKPNSLHPERGKLLSKWKYDRSHHIINGEQRFYSYKNQQTFSVCPMYVSSDYCYYHKDYVDDFTLDSVVYYKGSTIFKKVGYRYNDAKQLSRQI